MEKEKDRNSASAPDEEKQKEKEKEKQKQKCNFDFKWGMQRGVGVGVKNKDIVFYDSFTYEGEQYRLYDCVYFNLGAGEPEASIGKVVKMYEGPNHVKKVKVVWFMRPADIRNFLGDYQPRWNELSLASGHGLGLSNVNPLESIAGKCNVVCTSNDPRNPQASETDLRLADYFFCRHFDVGELAILDVFPDMVDGVKVEDFFNKKKEQKLLGPPNLKSNVTEHSRIRIKIKRKIGDTVRDDDSGNRVGQLMKESMTVPVSVSKPVHLPSESTPPRPKTSIPSGGNQHGGKLESQAQDEVKDPKYSPIGIAETQPFKKRKLLDEKASSTFYNLDHQLGQDRGINIDNQLVQVPRRPDADRRNWFKQLPWEQRLERAEEAGCLVSLENLDASYTADEVEDLLWFAFKEKVEAKMIQQSTFSCPHYGKALIIFKSKEAAQSAIIQLMKRCLMLADGRPVIARKEALRKPGSESGFVGHHTLDRVQLQRQSEHMRKAKSTSHPSQPNNIEYDMGMEWRVLQAKSDILCKKLYEGQAKEIQNFRNQLKMKWNRYLHLQWSPTSRKVCLNSFPRSKSVVKVYYFGQDTESVNNVKTLTETDVQIFVCKYLSLVLFGYKKCLQHLRIQLLALRL